MLPLPSPSAAAAHSASTNIDHHSRSETARNPSELIDENPSADASIEDQAATIIQRWWRQRLVRGKGSATATSVIQDRAATAIQRAFRTSKNRQALLPQRHPAGANQFPLKPPTISPIADQRELVKADAAARVIQQAARKYLIKSKTSVARADPTPVKPPSRATEHALRPTIVKFVIKSQDGSTGERSKVVRFPIADVESVLTALLPRCNDTNRESKEALLALIDQKGIPALAQEMLSALAGKGQDSGPSPASPCNLNVSDAKIARLLVEARTAQSFHRLPRPLTERQAIQESERNASIYARQRHTEKHLASELQPKSELADTGAVASSAAAPEGVTALSAKKVARVMLYRNQGRARTWHDTKRAPSALRKEVSVVPDDKSRIRALELGRGLDCRCAEPSQSRKIPKRGMLYLQSRYFGGPSKARSTKPQSAVGTTLGRVRFALPTHTKVLGSVSIGSDEQATALDGELASKEQSPLYPVSQEKREHPSDQAPQDSKPSEIWTGFSRAERVRALQPCLANVAAGAREWHQSPDGDDALPVDKALRMVLSAAAPAIAITPPANGTMHRDEVLRQLDIAVETLSQTAALHTVGPLERTDIAEGHGRCADTALVLSTEGQMQPSDTARISIERGKGDALLDLHPKTAAVNRDDSEAHKEGCSDSGVRSKGPPGACSATGAKASSKAEMTNPLHISHEAIQSLVRLVQSTADTAGCTGLPASDVLKCDDKDGESPSFEPLHSALKLWETLLPTIEDSSEDPESFRQRSRAYAGAIDRLGQIMAEAAIIYQSQVDLDLQWDALEGPPSSDIDITL